MRNRTYEIDMVNGSIFKNLIRFAIPLMLGNLLQLLFNAADIVVVSRFAGTNAMASVGATTSLNTLIINGCIGISVGASVLVSRRYGARDDIGVHRAVHTSMILGLIVGSVSGVIGFIFSKTFLTWMSTPAGDVLEGASLYMRIYFIGVPASMVYNFGAAILRAVGDTKRPLYILSAAGVINVVLNLILVIGFDLGVAGVAIATTVSNFISALAIVATLMRAEGAYHLVLRQLRLYKKELVEIFRIGVPSALQTMMFALANTVIQSSVNSFGEASIAGSAAGASIEGFVYTAMNAIYQAALTGISQNYGAKNKNRIGKVMRTAIIVVSVVGVVMGGLSFVFAKQLLGIYITDSPEAMAHGVIRIAYTGLPYFLCGIMDVMAGTLRGLGYSTVSATNSLIGACGFRLIWVNFFLPLNRTPQFLFLCWPISWVVVIAMHIITYLVVRKKAYSKMLQ